VGKNNPKWENDDFVVIFLEGKSKSPFYCSANIKKAVEKYE
jgi:hypothetical protein